MLIVVASNVDLSQFAFIRQIPLQTAIKLKKGLTPKVFVPTGPNNWATTNPSG